MENFSAQVVSNLDYNPKNLSFGKIDQYEENCQDRYNIIFSKKNSLKYSKKTFFKCRLPLFDIDISTVYPSFQIIDKMSKINENFNSFKFNDMISFDFEEEIPPNESFKIEIEIGKYEKYKPDKSDFKNII